MQIRIEAIILAPEPFEILARHAWSEHERFDLYADEERISEAIGGFRRREGWSPASACEGIKISTLQH